MHIPKRAASDPQLPAPAQPACVTSREDSDTGASQGLVRRRLSDTAPYLC